MLTCSRMATFHYRILTCFRTLTRVLYNGDFENMIRSDTFLQLLSCSRIRILKIFNVCSGTDDYDDNVDERNNNKKKLDENKATDYFSRR
jgi:hypothetical protein